MSSKIKLFLTNRWVLKMKGEEIVLREFLEMLLSADELKNNQ